MYGLKRTLYSCFSCPFAKSDNKKPRKTSKNVKKEKKGIGFFVNFHNSIEKPRKFLRNSCKTF